MPIQFAPKIKKENLDFGSDYNETRYKQFLRANDGKRVKIEIFEDPVSEEMRGYVFGALIPFLRQIDPYAWSDITNDQIYEVLKKNFNYFEAWNPLTGRMDRYGQSVLNLSCENKKATEFIKRIESWVLENYAQTIPLPREYKKFLNTVLIKNKLW